MRYYNLSFLFFVAALLSKSVTASLPAVLLVIRWWKRGRVGWPDVQPLVRFFLAGTTLGLFTAWYEKNYVGRSATNGRWARWIVRSSPAGPSGSMRASSSGRGRLVFFYPHWEFGAGRLWQCLFALVAVAFLAALGRRVSASVAARWPPLSSSAEYYVPVLGFLNVYPFRYSFVADHFQYHAGIALVALAAATFATLAARLHRLGQFCAFTAVGVVLAALAAVTFHARPSIATASPSIPIPSSRIPPAGWPTTTWATCWPPRARGRGRPLLRNNAAT